MKFHFAYARYKYILTLLLCCLCFNYMYSQKVFNIKDKEIDKIAIINDWVKLVFKHYDVKIADSVNKWVYLNGYDKNNQYNMRADRNFPTFSFHEEHRWTTLFSDEFFVPMFGEPLDKMPDKTIAKIKAALYDCLKKPELSKQTFYVSRLYGGLNQSTYYVPKIQQIRAEKQLYKEIMEKFSDPKFVMSEEDIKRFPLSKYKSLTPTELIVLIRSLEKEKKGAFDNIAQQKLDAVLQLPPGPGALYRTIAFFKENGYTSTDKISADLLQQFHTTLNQHFDHLINILMAQESKKIDSLPAGEAGIDAGNELFINFEKKYVFSFDGEPDYLGKNTAVVRIKQKYIAGRNASLTLLKPELDKKISSADKEAVLNNLYNKYLKYFVENKTVKAEIAQTLAAAIDDRKAALGQNKTSMSASIDAGIKKQKEDYLKKITAKAGMLKFDGLNNNYYQQAYLRDFNAYDDGTDDMPRVMFKMLLAMYSEKCAALLPNKKRTEIKVLQQTGTTIINRVGRNGLTPFSASPNFDRVTIATFYTHPEFNSTFEDFSVIASQGDIWGLLLLDGRMYPERYNALKSKSISVLQDAIKLIDNNGCSNPGIYTIMENLNYHVAAYKKPKAMVKPAFTKENGYTYNEAGNYYEKHQPAVYSDTVNPSILERNFLDAPPNFTPPLIYPPDINKGTIKYNIYYADDGSTGVTHVEIRRYHEFELGLTPEWVAKEYKMVYSDRKSNQKLQIPADIEKELKANKYIIVALDYNNRYAGTLERKNVLHWYTKGGVPSQKLQDFFKDRVKKPIDRIDLLYDTEW